MNKRGGIFLATIFTFIFIIMGFLFIPYIQDSALSATTSLDCNNISITDGTKTTCLIIDSGLPYFIIAIFALAGGFIGNEL